MNAQISDHLWQSTVILCIAGILTLLLRKNRAGARYWLWFVASIKFLLPLSLFSALVRFHTSQSAVPMLAGPTSEFAQRISDPFVQGQSYPNVSAAGSTVTPALDFSSVLLIIWALGCVAVLFFWLFRWRRIGRALLSSRPLSVAAPIPLHESPTLIEPGLVGVWSPVILLPAGLGERLTPAELESILAHELSHYRRRDNLTAAAHMVVEALFWFYPPIWWLGARLVAERERACDEEVLAAGNDPEVYAESILKVCRFFKPSSIACASGVSGADLRGRVEEIMSGRKIVPIGRPKKLLVVLSIAAVLLGMVVLGGMSVPPTQAQSSGSAFPSPAERAKLLAEQTAPQKEVPFNPEDFDKFVGYYKDETSGLYAQVYRNGSHYYSQLTGQGPVEFFAESQTEFFATVVAAQISFVSNHDGRVTGMVIHQNGFLRPWLKSSKSAYDTAEAELQQRIMENAPGPGTEAAVRRQIEEIEKTGHALYSAMSPALAAAAHEQAEGMTAMFKRMGAFDSLRFSRVLPNGTDDYLATFANGKLEITISPISRDGKIPGILYRLVPGAVEQQRVQDNKPSPGTEASIRRFITSWEEKGRPNYEDMERALADNARSQAQTTALTFQQLGAFESLKFVQINSIGMDLYEATFAHGAAEFMIAPLDANGKVVTREWHVLPIGFHVVMPGEKSFQPPDAGSDLSKIYQVGKDASPPKLIYAPDPIYPPNETGEGAVVVKLVVDTKGMPQQVRVIQSFDFDPAFANSAIHAVEEYRFTPATLVSNSKRAVAVEVQIAVNFRQH